MKMLMVLFVLVGCASRTYVAETSKPYYTVEIDAISGQNSSPKSFSLVSGIKGVKESDLRFKEIAEVASKALENGGFTPSSKPDIKIVLTYSVSDPRTHVETDSSPTYGMRTTNFNNSFGTNIGSAQSFGQTGTEIESTVVTKYLRKVVLKAFSASTNEELWETTVTSSGSSPDLRKVLPYLLYAGTKYYGKSTDQQLVRSVDVDDARVQALTRKPASP